MTVEREILVSVLKHTKNGLTNVVVVRNAGIPIQQGGEVLEELREAGLVELEGGILKASTDQRVGIAIEAVKLGADFQEVCGLLRWREFESIATRTFEAHNFNVEKNFRFKEKNGKRWEIDLVSWKKPIVVSVDCKHWKKGWTKSQIVDVVEEHIKRTKAFADVLPNLRSRFHLVNWEHATVIPVVLSLLPGPFRFHRNIPVVPVLQIQSFLNEIPAHASLLTSFSVELLDVSQKLIDF